MKKSEMYRCESFLVGGSGYVEYYAERHAAIERAQECKAKGHCWADPKTGIVTFIPAAQLRQIKVYPPRAKK